MGIGDYSLCCIFPLQQKNWGQSCSAVLIFRNPRKAMFHPKSVSRGVAGSYCWLYYMGIGVYSICSIFPLQQRISRPKLFGCTHFPQPRKAKFAPKSVSRGVAGSYCWVYYIGKENSVFSSIFPLQQRILSILHGHWGLQYLLIFPLQQTKIEAKAFRLYSFSANPGKICLLPKVSLGGLRERTVQYITWVKGITVFAQSFHCNRDFRGQSWSAVLISRNPRKPMFAPKSVSRGVAGSYYWV